MLVKIEKNNKLALPKKICQDLRISKGDRFYASIKEGRSSFARAMAKTETRIDPKRMGKDEY